MRHLHQLKTHPSAFRAVILGDKRAEFRKNDRGFSPGDVLVLSEFDPEPIITGGHFTGQNVLVRITHMVQGPAYGIPEGFAMLSIEVEAVAPPRTMAITDTETAVR